jgi:peptidoglycan/xylan/chitin deacetylase (PgdA/CDA1 family)
VSDPAAAGLTPTQLPDGADVPRALSLTFDDGPDATWTPLVLEQLTYCQVTATFFMVGERVLAHPGLARTVLAAGHDIQLHCYRHIRHTELTEVELQRDTEMAIAALASTGAYPQLWRAPWGICTEASVRVAERLGLALVRWSIDTHDWRGDSPQKMLTDVCMHMASGGTVLMHDALGPGARRAGCQNTLALLPALTAAARDHGLALAPMRHADPRAISQPALGMPA